MTDDQHPSASSSVRHGSQMVQDRYRLLFERSPDALIVVDPAGAILDSNASAIAFLGLSRLEPYQSNLSAYYADQAQYGALIRQAEATGFVQDEPALFVDGRGQLKHGLVTIMRLDDPNGRSYGYQSLIRDVTRNRLIEQGLNRQKDYAEQLIEMAPEAIAILDTEDRVIRVNQEFCRLFQYSRHHCIGRRVDELIVPQSLKAESLSLSARAIGGACFEVETQRKRRDGSLVDVSILAKPIATETDETAVYVIYRDISERKQAQEALKQSEARHRTMLEAAPDPVIVRDMQDRVLYLNPAFTRVLGWTLDDCRNRVLDFVPAEHQPETQAFMDRIRQGKTFSGVETRRITKDGRLVDVSISGAVFLDPQGKPEGYVNTLQDITDRRMRDEELRFVAYHDTLTGLPNRKSFYMSLDDLLQHGSRRNTDRTWALMFLDLDRFKQINDTLGHDKGDQLLKQVARRLKNCLRETDRLFRLGGDEFTVILTHLSHDIDVARIAGKIMQALNRPFQINGHEVVTTTSIGVSVFPNDGLDVESLVKSADMAMYAAKENGGNRYRFFTEEMHRIALHRMRMESSLKKALDRDELVVLYQPLVDETERIVGMEALLRWRHPELGLILPADFIHITEETGSIVPIGRWVLQTACREASQLHDKGFSELFLAVNVSAKQIQEPDFEQMVIDILNESGLPPRCLSLEMTESAVIQNPEVCIAKMRRLRAWGISFSIDDFGVGYSSLNYLKRFPIDALKIDRSFICDAINSKGDREIIKTIITMAHNLEIEAVAEGVETRQQKAFLVNHGCNSMQGFLFAHPVPMERLEELLESRKQPRVIPDNASERE